MSIGVLFCSLYIVFYYNRSNVLFLCMYFRSTLATWLLSWNPRWTVWLTSETTMTMELLQLGVTPELRRTRSRCIAGTDARRSGKKRKKKNPSKVMQNVRMFVWGVVGFAYEGKIFELLGQRIISSAKNVCSVYFGFEEK